MLNYTIRRLVGAIPTLFIILAVSFFMMRMAPGGPFDKERKVPAEVEAKLIQQYHLDEPLPQQFVRYIGGLAQGDFGPSFKYKDFYRLRTDLRRASRPRSALGLSAIALALVIGVTLGIWAALRQNSWIDYLGVGTAMLGHRRAELRHRADPDPGLRPDAALAAGRRLGQALQLGAADHRALPCRRSPPSRA